MKIDAYDISVTFKENVELDIVTIKKGAVLDNIHVQVEFDPLDLDHDELVRHLDDEGFKVISHEKYEDLDSEPSLNDFGDDAILEELEYREVAFSLNDDILWSFKAGKHEEFLEELERQYPIELAGIARMKLIRE